MPLELQARDDTEVLLTYREVVDALLRLHPDLRAPLAMTAAGFERREIAHRLGLNEETVKYRIARARELLRLWRDEEPTLEG